MHKPVLRQFHPPGHAPVMFLAPSSSYSYSSDSSLMMSNVRWIDWKAGTPPAGGDL
jgi:hypothetical protein